MRFGDFNLHIIRESRFKLDGGAMFGVVPKALWNKAMPADQINRVTLACNLLLIETPKGRVLVETGMGNRWQAREKERYDLQILVDHKNLFADLGLTNADIDAVIMSHLHFDHAGGALLELDGKPVPAFPNARYYSQKGEFDFAFKANARARASYRFEDFMPLKDAGVLELLDGDKEILPGVSVHVSGGHTSHHQIVSFESAGLKGVYFADILPTSAHLSPPWVMGYDHFPLSTCDAKSKWLALCASEKWLVVFDHEPGVCWGHVTLSAEGKFSFEPLAEDTLSLPHFQYACGKN